MKKQEKEPLTELISVKTSIKMKEGLMELAAEEERDFSDYLRLLWKKTLANAGKSLKKSKKV